MTSGGNNTERARGKPWKLLSVTTGNCSAIEKVSLYKTMPKAEAQRMMETKAVRLFDENKTNLMVRFLTAEAISDFDTVQTCECVGFIEFKLVTERPGQIFNSGHIRHQEFCFHTARWKAHKLVFFRQRL